MDFFDEPENSTKYRVKSKSYILFGHSMGGGIALLVGAKDSRISKIGAFSPLGGSRRTMPRWRAMPRRRPRAWGWSCRICAPKSKG